MNPWYATRTCGSFLPGTRIEMGVELFSDLGGLGQSLDTDPFDNTMSRLDSGYSSRRLKRKRLCQVSHHVLPFVS